jgi:hypothetical protein
MVTDPLVALQYYAQLLQNNVMVWFLYAPLLLVAIDLLTGVLAAVKQGIFTWKRFTTFWTVSIDPYLTIVIIVYLTYLISGSAVASNVAIALGMLSHASATLGSIVENLKELQVAPPVIQEVENVAQSYFQHPPLFPETLPTSTRQVLAPLSVPQAQVAVDRVTTQAVPTVIRMNTPPMILPAPVPVVSPLATLPPVSLDATMIPTYPSGL